MFGIDSNEKLPQEFFWSHKAWDAYMANLWYDLLNSLDFYGLHNVVEIGSGNSVKIGMALAKLDFKGSVFLVDPFQEALEEASKSYLNILPKAEIKAVAKTLADSLNFLPRESVCLVSNHCIDDMIMVAGQSEYSLTQLFEWTAIEHEQTIPLSKKVWADLEADPLKLSIIKNQVYRDCCSVIENLQPRLCIFGQYPSITLKNADMNNLNIHASEILQKLHTKFINKVVPESEIQKILNTNKHFNDLHIGNEVLNAGNWFVLKNKNQVY